MILISGLIVLTASYFVITMSSALWNVYRSRTWVSTKGRTLGRKWTPGIDYAILPSLAGIHAPRVQYVYRVREREFSGSRVNFVGFTRAEAARTREFYDRPRR